MACLCHLSPNSERRTHEQNCEPNHQCEWNHNSPEIIQVIFKVFYIFFAPALFPPPASLCVIWDRTSQSFPALSGRLIMAPFQWETVRSGCPVKPSQAICDLPSWSQAHPTNVKLPPTLNEICGMVLKPLSCLLSTNLIWKRNQEQLRGNMKYQKCQ